MAPEPIRRWHAVVERRDITALRDLLAPDAVFLSPVVHSPQEGAAIVTKYLTAAMHLLNTPHFRYLEEWYGETSAILEFQTEVDGILINGVDMIHWNAEGRITRFKVMVRPLKAMNILHQKMMALLAAG